MVRPISCIIIARALFEDSDETITRGLFIQCVQAMFDPFHLFGRHLFTHIVPITEDLATLSEAIQSAPENEALLVILPKADCGETIERLLTIALDRTVVVSQCWSEPISSEFSIDDLNNLRTISHNANRLAHGVYIPVKDAAPIKVEPGQSVVFDNHSGCLVIKS